MDTTQIRLAERPVGEPDASTFTTATETLPDLEDGQVALAIRYLSLDPYMRGRLSTAKSYAAPVEIGDVMVGGTVGEVVESRFDGLAPGDFVLSYSGWQTAAIADGHEVRKLDPSSRPSPRRSGVLGMPGFTAYAGLLEIGQPEGGRDRRRRRGHRPGRQRRRPDRQDQGRPRRRHRRRSRQGARADRGVRLRRGDRPPCPRLRRAG